MYQTRENQLKQIEKIQNDLNGPCEDNLNEALKNEKVV